MKGISQGRQDSLRIGCEVHVFNILTFSFLTKEVRVLIMFKLYYYKSPARCF